jgi:hypothetical protein
MNLRRIVFVKWRLENSREVEAILVPENITPLPEMPSFIGINELTACDFLVCPPPHVFWA